MPFAGHLSTNELLALVSAAIDADLLDISRSLRLQGIPRPFVLGLKRADNDLEQFELDLYALNGVERLTNGEVPLVQLLQNAARQLRLRARPEAETFERYANLIGNRSRGVVDLPDPAQLPEVVQHEAIISQDDMVDFVFLQRGMQVGRSVARIVVPRFENKQQIVLPSGAPWLMTGTAWMIGPALTITNHHVINARKADEGDAAGPDFNRQGQEAVLEFDFDHKDAARVAVGVAQVEAASKELDYAVLRLKENSTRPALPISPQPLALNATSYIAVNVIQHPRGEAKRVAFRNNLVSGADNQIVRYFTDTDFGSSGSPVCDDDWRVVALHRGARYVQGVRYQGKDAGYVNFGSQMQAVLADLRRQLPAVHAEVLAGQPGLQA